MRRVPRKYQIVAALILLPVLVFWLFGGFRTGSPSARLTVGFLGAQYDPVSHPPNGPTVLNGGTGRCAVFAVTNAGENASLWFDTCALEQKVAGEWRRTPVPPYALRVVDRLRAGSNAWFLIASDEVNNVYPPGRAWFFVVAWPPDVPTNSCWRLGLRYGPAPSATASKLDAALGINFFARRRGEMLFTPEVRR